MNEIGIFRPIELNIHVKCDPKNLVYIVEELTATEKDYVEYLKMIVDGTVFPALEDSVSKFCQVIKDDTYYMEMYIEYCGNFPVSEVLETKYSDYFTEIKKKLNHILALSDLLIKPIQRLPKYKLMMEQIYSCLIQTDRRMEANELMEALLALNKILDDSDKFMTIKKLKHFPKDVTKQGKLLLCDIFYCSCEDKSNRKIKKKKYLQQCLFLLEKCVIISDITGNKKNYMFLYKDHVKVCSLKFRELKAVDLNKKFTLEEQNSSKSYTCKTLSSKVYESWIQNLNCLIQERSNFVLSLADPIEFGPK